MKQIFALTGKVAIITGSTSGIGIGIAEVFAERGAHVVVCGRNEERGAAVVSGIVENGGKASFHVMDAHSEMSIKALIDDTVAEYGRLDILVNNAANTTGHAATDIQIAEIPVEVWDSVFSSDLRSAFIACKYAIPYMQKNGGGSIINTGSTAAALGNASQGAYSSAKGGLEMLTRNVAYQYGKDNIRCNCIRPGLIIHPQNNRSVPGFLREVFMKETEVTRHGNPRDIGYMALFFASDEAGYVTSQIINVDGGMFCHAPQNTGMREATERMMARAKK